MATVRESRGPDSDGNGSLTPSEQSDNDDRSENDSDYETDDGDDRLESRGKAINIQWTGYGKRVPVILFNAETILNKRTDFKTVGERYHLAFKFASTDCKIVRNILLSHGFHEVHPNSAEYNLIWSNSHLKPFTLRTMSEFQKINHFPRSYELTRKDRLFKNIQRMQQLKGHKHFDFIPPSFVLPGDYQDFCSSFLKDKGPYIVKPVASSRGRGVFLINHPDQVPLDENVIVSKYISSPLVIDGFKFDMRIYVAVTSYDPLVIYLYEEGLTRFATVKYEKNIKHMRNQCMHLTNYSVNKRSQDYVKNDDPDVEDYGNKWSMGAMLRYLRSEGKDTAALMMRIEDVVIKTILSVESSVATACKMFQPFRGNCFELYGFDILLDETLKPWVLEVNLSPSLACDSPLDLKIKCNMLCDLFSLAGVICHDPLMRSRQQVNKQATEITTKLKSRLKGELDDGTAELLGQIEAARLYMKDTDAWLMSRSRPHSAMSSASKERLTTSLAGLNSDEVKIVRRVKEEEDRKGGWIRIFPSADSWDTHGSFLQFPTTHNLMLHQRLHPDRHKGIPNKSPGAAAIAPSRSKTGIHLQVTGAGKVDQEKFIESYAQAILRAKQYERRLGQVKKSHRRKHSKSKRNKLIQGAPEAEDNAEIPSDEEVVNDRGKDRKARDTKSELRGMLPERVDSKLASTRQTVPIKVHFSAGKESANSAVKDKDLEKTQEKDEAVAPGEPHQLASPNLPSPVSKFDIIGQLEKGHTLNKIQARTAFAMYLIRVQQRLLSDCGMGLQQEDVDALNEQMDLVLRFLKRAAANLPQAFRIVVPSKKLPLGDRRRILAKQLGDFVHLYNKETDHIKALKVRGKMENRKPRRSESCDDMDEIQFDQFVYTAAEGELEEVLTTYTKINKSAAIFLGSDSKLGGGSMSESRREFRRREIPDILCNTMATGGSDETSMMKQESTGPTSASVNNNNNISFSTAILGGGVNPGISSLSGISQLQHNFPHSSCVPAVSIYTQKLGRPRSAMGSVTCTAQGSLPLSRPVSVVTRPMSVVTNNPLASAQTAIFTTLDPTVDTYHEKAIQEAIQQLALRQHARHYSSTNGINVLTKPPRGMWSAASNREQNGYPQLSVTGQAAGQFSLLTNNLPLSHGSGQLCKALDNQLTHPVARHVTEQSTIPIWNSAYPEHSFPRPVQSQLSAGNIVDNPSSRWPSEILCAYNEVTGVSSQNYHTASTNSRQFLVAQQLALKQQMMDQSKAMLEQSKAKHDAALVSQTQMQKSLSSMAAMSHIQNNNVIPVVSFPDHDHMQASKTVIPKPPEHLYSRPPRSGYRSSKKLSADEDNLNFNFQSNLLATGQDL